MRKAVGKTRKRVRRGEIKGDTIGNIKNREQKGEDVFVLVTSVLYNVMDSNKN